MTDTIGGVEPEDWTHSDAIRVLGIALMRRDYEDEPGSLPSNGTMGDIAFDDADRTMERCPGLRYVIEAGIRALGADDRFQAWLVPLYAGGEDDCRRTELAIAATFPPDPEPDPNAMTADQIADAMIAHLHDRQARGEL